MDKLELFDNFLTFVDDRCDREVRMMIYWDVIMQRFEKTALKGLLFAFVDSLSRIDNSADVDIVNEKLKILADELRTHLMAELIS